MKKIYIICAGIITAASMQAMDFQSFEKVLVTPPADMSTKSYLLTVDAQVWDSSIKTSEVVVGFYDSKVYIQGLSSDFPTSWVEGNVDGDKITIPSGQYYGENFMMGFEMFFCAADKELKYDEAGNFMDVTFTPAEELVCTYNAEAGTFESDGTFLTYLRSSWNDPEEFAYMGCNFNPRFTPLEYVATTPKTPEVTFVQEYNEESNIASVVFYMSTIGEDGEVMNPENMYYNIYLDGELYTFMEDFYYTFGDVTDVPYLFNNYINISNDSGNVMIDLYEPFDSIGARLVYTFDGVEYKSAIGEWKTSSVKDIDEGKELSGKTYFDLQGRKVANPEKGIFVVVSNFTDGTSSISKTFLK